MRSFLMHVPPKYTGSVPVPVVFDFHGYGITGKQHSSISGFRELADREGFLVVYPEGVGGSWHVNGCCGEAATQKIDEIAFVHEVFAALKKEACVDTKRVYASGLSQGGGMTHHVGCLAGDIFAAVAPVSSDLRTEPCKPSFPISEIAFRGEADTQSPYEGGHVGPAGMDGYESIGAEATLERWKTIASCTGAPTTTNELCETYSTCAGGAEVSLCSVPRGGHQLYDNPENFDVAQTAWVFFKKHPK
jgi:poly(3-hydroxybutyrate) depolymerase